MTNKQKALVTFFILLEITVIFAMIANNAMIAKNNNNIALSFAIVFFLIILSVICKPLRRRICNNKCYKTKYQIRIKRNLTISTNWQNEQKENINKKLSTSKILDFLFTCTFIAFLILENNIHPDVNGVVVGAYMLWMFADVAYVNSVK